MKRKKLQKRLKHLELSKETIRALTQPDLQRAVGGYGTDVFTGCPTVGAMGSDMCCQEH